MDKEQDTVDLRMRQQEIPADPLISLFLPLVQSIAASLASSAESLAVIASSVEKPQIASEDKETIALALLATMWPKVNVTAIAKEVGVSRAALYSMPKFRRYLNQAKASPGRITRGSKSDDGSIEAWD